MRLAAVCGLQRWRLVFTVDDLGRVETHDFTVEQVVGFEFAQAEAPRTDFKCREAPAGIVLKDTAQQVFAAVLQ